MNDGRKSNRPVVATKSSNKATEVAAERMERRGLAKGKTPRQNTDRTLYGYFAASISNSHSYSDSIWTDPFAC